MRIPLPIDFSLCCHTSGFLRLTDESVHDVHMMFTISKHCSYLQYSLSSSKSTKIEGTQVRNPFIWLSHELSAYVQDPMKRSKDSLLTELKGNAKFIECTWDIGCQDSTPWLTSPRSIPFSVIRPGGLSLPLSAFHPFSIRSRILGSSRPCKHYSCVISLWTFRSSGLIFHGNMLEVACFL